MFRENKNIYIALENIRSLFNIGAVFRTCSFFGFTNVILVGYSGKTKNTKNETILNKEILKSSLGSEKDLQITFLETSDDLIKFCEENELNLISIEQRYKSIKLSKPEMNLILNDEKGFVLVFGNEVSGVSDIVLKHSKADLEIPRLGKHNSLNVTTACGIVLYELSRI
ncbi:hypothetical protein A3F07_03070 [candidate division WWE3 bacterium RIFCSPHIGHO2_12_FULL_38_15]|uniref:tRNA/rRNA methyltransferase SpoU type domain-containing protein n=1 Tax=candidate division WWE3 bacterium RIFCSPHIGHO2_02_FULL_38_14 TaxID=1802620 RepID=A0A1F4V9J7_UNCKA|nr:MAG: hypothetical protein A3F07_03070 [candidate division WWE3 bacterium RIFCSPHIGHO2_12_FULL_38_15]OGC52737.1 MAG: hypothetical protein A3B64_01005 [candidate division WWE3 bacterium RIFCSPLOWO2_01_FULL_37_24]OGC53931.1 MAG: hypothetical protein A3D91_04060 [candidate division WWE3 bacterium RIFCSPHIGHO2_02_FULL_38_14]HLB52061.1 TrmH family RNA methyltransferase [Patescibacteria group bacterium]